MSKNVHHLRATQYGGEGELSITRTDTLHTTSLILWPTLVMVVDRLAAGTQAAGQMIFT